MVWIWEVNFCILVVPGMQSIAGSRGLPKWVPSEMGVGGDFGGEIEIWVGRLRWTNWEDVFKITLAS